ncbi:Lysosomal pro-x carboxypeptidase [Thalictrum thalictroides]|uniref:Lysosomal pro-x carboxypeptidase n=1 Tax=Thalictrum thalictroides TaxID=46969 RepID=A0A7J6WCQ9_THATH|nr:Lysosomal pro-x carboxypeptidase [Thalictrum thalictroides]
MDQRLVMQLLLPCLLVLVFIRCASSEHWQIPELSMSMRTSSIMISDSTYDELPPDEEIHFYTQTLDHFNYRPESYATFQQRYVINSKYWGGVNNNSPIFVYMGSETSIIGVAASGGFMTDNAPYFKALIHRYYGDSVPFKEADQNASTLGYFSSTQALADYAELIINLKKNLSAENCPVIVFGGSYGGMLATWFRLKYPHIALGALASSAPILYFDDITPQNGYHVIVTKDYKEASESCYNTIRESWSEIDKVGADPGGLNLLSQRFNTCKPLDSTKELKDNLGLLYVIVAQYDAPPDYPVTKICDAIDELPEGADILSRISAGFAAALNITFRETGCKNVVDLKPSKMSRWQWQTCTEMVMPIGYHENETMFQSNPFDLNKFIKNCQNLFGVTPRPHWITTEFGGHVSCIYTNYLF